MAKILVAGGGRQGRVIAADLAIDHEVTVADLQPCDLPGVRSVVADLADAEALAGLMREHDLAVGALPAALGFAAAKAAIAARRNYVDCSFYEEDAYSLDAEAKAAGIAIVPDCGLAPGLSNLVAGRAQTMRKRNEIHIQVGGVAADPQRPYGYVITWSPADLWDEYTRPARFRRENQVQTLPVFSEIETIQIDGVGEMESFLTDGCRTLLTMDVPELTEKTLRWPGHVDAIQPLIAGGGLIDELLAKCTAGDDLVVFRVQADDEVVTMVDRARDGMSAMSRTTALTCAAFARWAATGNLKATGVVTGEALGVDPQAFRFILEALQRHEIYMSPRFPFLPSEN